MLHIHNGDCSANIAKQSSLPGEHFAWRESLITGPTPSGLSADDWRRIRAEHLSQSYGVPFQECECGLLEQQQKLETFREHEEVVLWFEHDLFCQTNLIYLLHWFSQQDLGRTKLSLICIDGFPGKGNFRGLGELNAAEMASLFPARRTVTSAQLKLATAAWRAYSSADPSDIETILQADTSLLPFLAAALVAHLRRFPSVKNGLGRIEDRGLELIDGGSKNFIDAFPRFGDAEPIYGLGDAQFWLALQKLSVATHPLLKLRKRMPSGSPTIREGSFQVPSKALPDGRASASFEGQNGEQHLTTEIIRDVEFDVTELGKSG